MLTEACQLESPHRSPHLVCAHCILYRALMPPFRKLGFRAGFRLDSNRESIKISTSASRRTYLETFPTPKSGPEARCQARKHQSVTEGSVHAL